MTFAHELLAEVEPLSYQARCARLASLRDRAGTPELAELLAELGRRGPYERSLALLAAAATRDPASLAHIAGAMRDEDAAIAAQAVGLTVRLGAAGATELAGLVDDAPAELRARLYRAIRTYQRTDLAESLIRSVGERWGAAEAVALLPVCGEATVRALLPELAHAVSNWGALGRAHPGPLLDHAERDLAQLPSGQRWSWWTMHSAALAAASGHDPARVIGLLEDYWDQPGLNGTLVRRFSRLVASDPERMTDLLLGSMGRQELRRVLSVRGVRDRLVRLLTEDRLAGVLRAVREDTVVLALMLKTLPPSRRAAAFDAAMEGIDLSTRELEPQLLEVLPAAVREREATRMLGLRRVAEDPWRTLEVSAFLPYGQAAERLREATRRADAEERGRGYELLIACAGRTRDPQVLGDLLTTDLARLRNEQDPVRARALDALTKVPKGLLRAEHTAAFTRLIEDALNARDMSFATGNALARLVSTAFQLGAVRGDQDMTLFAIEAMRTLTRHGGGQPMIHGLDRLLRRGQEHELVRSLAPELEKDVARDEFRLTLSLVNALGRRAYGVPELQDALSSALLASREGVVRMAIDHWLAPPRTRAERVALILELDRSAIVLQNVFRTVATVRSDLLWPVLSGTPQEGRFWRHLITYVPLAHRDWTRQWTAAQRAAYLTLLRRAADDGSARETERADAVRMIGNVAGVPADELRPYLRSKNALIRRSAMTAVVWTASPQRVLGELLAEAGGDDAHVALYAVTRAARFTPPSTLPGALAPVLADGKVTARKEAVRLLAHHRSPGADQILAREWDREGQHRDVRAAIASVARQRLDLPNSERILTEAVEGPRDLARQVLGERPLLVEPHHRARYAALVVRAARSADPEVRAEALNRLAQWVPWSPEAMDTLARQTADLAETVTWRNALNGLVTSALSGPVDALRDAVASLVATTEPADAEAERDLPIAQRLDALVEALTAAAAPNRDQAAPALAAVDGLLPEPLGAILAAGTLAWDDAVNLDTLLDRPVTGTAALMAVAEALAKPLALDEMQRYGLSLGSFDAAVDPQTVLPGARRAVARADLPGGIVAAALVGTCGPRAGWSEPWRDLLRGLRSHPHPDVVFLARQVHTAGE